MLGLDRCLTEVIIQLKRQSPVQTKQRNRIERNCAVASLGVHGFATSSRQSRTVSFEIQILNRSSVASLGVRYLATGSQQVVHRRYV